MSISFELRASKNQCDSYCPFVLSGCLFLPVWMPSSLWKTDGKGWVGIYAKRSVYQYIWFSGISVAVPAAELKQALESVKPYPVQGTGGHLRRLFQVYWCELEKRPWTWLLILIQRWRRWIFWKRVVYDNEWKKKKEFQQGDQGNCGLRNISWESGAKNA